MSCQMQYAERNGSFVIKLQGDVRVPLCTSLERFIDEQLLTAHNLSAALIDLTETDAIDSTALGLLARVAVGLKSRGKGKPVILCLSEDIHRILASMGFQQVFRILQTSLAQNRRLDELPQDLLSEAEITECVIEAHRTLMSLNDRNAETFKPLVDALEAQRHPHSPSSGEPGRE